MVEVNVRKTSHNGLYEVIMSIGRGPLGSHSVVGTYSSSLQAKRHAKQIIDAINRPTGLNQKEDR